MSDTFDFFERSLQEKRTYNLKNPFHMEHIMQDLSGGNFNLRPQVQPFIEVVSLREPEDLESEDYFEECVIRGSHVMAPECPTGVQAINKRFGIQLPPEIDEFYRMWDGGLLVFRQFYEVFSVELIIKMALMMDDVPERPAGLPWHFLRFCGVENGTNLALRLGANGEWALVFEDLGVGAFDKHFDEACTPTIAPDFPTWLKRMCETDGLPLGSTLEYLDLEDYAAERLD